MQGTSMGEPEGTGGAQRREYFRTRIRLSLLIPTHLPSAVPREGVPFLAPTAHGTDYRILRVRDLSAGGCCCETTDDWPEVATRLTGYLYLDDARGPLELDLLVVRRDEPGSWTDSDEDEPRGNPETGSAPEARGSGRDEDSRGSDRSIAGDRSRKSGRVIDGHFRERAKSGDDDGSDEVGGSAGELIGRVAFQFLELRESKRQRILRALFREYRRQRRPTPKS